MQVAVLGGAGKMGQWLTRNLLKEGAGVTLIDRDEVRLKDAGCRLGVKATTELEAAGRAQVLVLAVPIVAFDEAVRSIAPYSRPGQIVIDIASVKTMPVKVMHEHLPRCIVLGAHPVCGPGGEGLRGQNVVLTPTNDIEEDLAKRLSTLLSGHGATVSLMTPEEHDRAMAVVLALTHYIAIVAGDTLLGLNDIKAFLQVSGPTFRSLLSFMHSVLHEDPELYASIQMNLPNVPQIEGEFVAKAGEWAELVRIKDAGQFIEKMSALRQTLEERGL